MTTQLNDITIIVNNEPVAYTPDTLKWMDGLGEFKTRNATLGGGQSEKIFSRDLTTKIGKVDFSLPTTEQSQKLKRAWKLNGEENVIQLVGASGSDLALVFTQAVLVNDPESNAATDGDTEFNFETNPAQ